MDRHMIAAWAKGMGLERALTEFPDDVFGAAEQALGQAAEFTCPVEHSVEPWPPMRPGIDL